MDWLDTPQFEALMKIEEPYEYRDRLTMPKFIMNASGDQFFLPDSSQFYVEGSARREAPALRAERAITRSADSDALESVHAFYAAIVSGTPRPAITWTFERDWIDQGRREGRGPSR